MTSLANHLWQSTIFAAAGLGAVWVLRHRGARLRYWIWLAASLKFLVPFGALLALGSQVEVRVNDEPVAPVVIEITRRALEPATPAAAPAPESAFWSLGALVWAAGTVTLLARWLRRWWWLRQVAATARPLALAFPVPVRESTERLEPGVFGILRPVLLVPRGLLDSLGDTERASILVHERAHLESRDNLTAALHMIVEALFWFHPLVWWIGARLLAEREHACDEAVVASGADRGQYASGLLTVCRHTVAAGLPCVAGVSGGDLRGRIQAILRGSIPRLLGPAGKAALAGSAAVVLALPIAVGALQSPERSPRPDVRFEVATIRPASLEARGRSINNGPVRLEIRNGSLSYLIQYAYDIQSFQLEGAPGWVSSDRYDLTATHDTQGESRFTRDVNARARLRALLAERFQLALRKTEKEMSVLALRQDKDGHKMKLNPQGAGVYQVNNNDGNVSYRADGFTMAHFAASLGGFAQRPVLDETGLAGSFDFQLEWASATESGPSLFTALKERLGLRLETSRGLVPLYVVERVEHPSVN